jgi:magnesium-transporting ATPase (P-type)
MIFKYEGPNAYLYNFNGTGTVSNGEEVPLDATNFILRGCSLRNTEWIYGLIAYTGYGTKLTLALDMKLKLC